MGRNVYEMADPFMWANDDYEFQTPIFVLTHAPPARYPESNGRLSFTFVTDGVASAVSQAQEAAGEQDVQVIGGASTIQQCLTAGLCDELQVDVMPVILGQGLSLFGNMSTDGLQLERARVEETTPLRTSVTFRVTRTNP